MFHNKRRTPNKFRANDVPVRMSVGGILGKLAKEAGERAAAAAAKRAERAAAKEIQRPMPPTPENISTRNLNAYSAKANKLLKDPNPKSGTVESQAQQLHDAYEYLLMTGDPRANRFLDKYNQLVAKLEANRGVGDLRGGKMLDIGQTLNPTNAENPDYINYLAHLAAEEHYPLGSRYVSNPDVDVDQHVRNVSSQIALNRLMKARYSKMLRDRKAATPFDVSPDEIFDEPTTKYSWRKGGIVKKYAKGGSVDGIAQRGKTKGKMR